MGKHHYDWWHFVLTVYIYEKVLGYLMICPLLSFINKMLTLVNKVHCFPKHWKERNMEAVYQEESYRN